MIPAVMGPARRLPLLASLMACVAMLAACGTQKVTVPKSDQADRRGADLFAQRCAGCHTLKAAGAHGSASDIRVRERNDGPNFNIRKESAQRVLYAIENGGFSGAIMPQNIVVGTDAEAVANFVAKYSGSVKGQNAPATGIPSGAPAAP
jgi:mono/diheme cytochrome c family protein